MNTVCKEQKIDEGNKLIAEFDDYEILDELHYKKRGTGNVQSINFYPFKYHLSWDWLMPVIEKIGTIKDFKNNIDINISYIFEGDIHSVWLTVVFFIKWYNQNKKNEHNSM